MKITLGEMEYIRQVYRQSQFILFVPITVTVLLIIFLYILLELYGFSGLAKTVLLVTCILGIIYLSKKIIIWWFHQFVVTNKRLILYQHTGLFKQVVVETPHERILNVSYKTTGLFSTIFNFGDVIVQVVGLVDPIILQNISQPMAIKDYLWEMHKRLAQAQSEQVFAHVDASHLQEQVGYSKGKGKER